MTRDQHIALYFREEEIGRIGHDANRNSSFFQYSPEFLRTGKYSNLFPFIIKRIPQVQVFNRFNSETFKGLPPVIADSLPDVFGNLIFKTWIESTDKDFETLSILKQLTYVGNRGMGALEYKPTMPISTEAKVDLDEIVSIIAKVMSQKWQTTGELLDTKALFNIFKIGSSAGGARPKILISEHKTDKKIIPGDLVVSEDYNHYLVKLSIPESDQHFNYNRETVEYSYYRIATELGIEMMPSHLVDGKHFATRRFDRQDGEKQHILTASGMVGWDFKDPEVSSYENLFKLASALNLPPVDLDQLFRRMVFNIVFFNIDDHLKNHSFIYHPQNDTWSLSPAYDLTYALNPILNVSTVSRALSVNGKRNEIKLADVLPIADKYSIKKPKTIIKEVQSKIAPWQLLAAELGIPERIIAGITKAFQPLI